MKVAFIHLDLGVGGAEQLVVNAAVCLLNMGHDVKIYTSHHDQNHCFGETKGEGQLADKIVTYGDWLPRYDICGWDVIGMGVLQGIVGRVVEEERMGLVSFWPLYFGHVGI